MTKQGAIPVIFTAALCLAASLPLTSLAQTCYDINGWDTPYDIAYDDDDNLMITGRTDGGLLFLRVSFSGETLAQRAIPLVEHPDSYSMVEADENTYIIGGADYLYGEPGDNLPFLLKVDSIGNELWRRTFLPTSEDFPSSIARHVIRNTEAETVYLATTDTVWMIAYDGTILAAQSAEEMGLPFFYSMDMVETDNGLAVLVFGDVILHFNENIDFLGASTMNLDIRTIYAFCAAPSGGFLIAGQGHDLHWKVIKVDDQGTTQWERTYTLPNYSWGYPKGIEAYEDGFLLVGRLIKVAPPNSCPALMKIDADGNPRWLKEMTDCDSDFRVEAFAIHSNPHLVHAVGKASCTPGNSNQDVVLLALDTVSTLVLAEKEATGESGFRLFPNPTNGTTQVVLPPNPLAIIWQVSLFDVSGQLALQQRGRSQGFQLNTSGLLPGLYLLRATDGRQVFSRRLIVGARQY